MLYLISVNFRLLSRLALFCFVLFSGTAFCLTAPSYGQDVDSASPAEVTETLAVEENKPGPPNAGGAGKGSTGEGLETQAATLATQEPEPVVEEKFMLSRSQHAWARFELGAWRNLETVTETFDENGKLVSRNVTLQKEKLLAISEDQYVLNVQATVELGGKRIVGDWKKRTLYLATDHAGEILGSHRLKDELFFLAGQPIECQVWEVRYRDGTRTLIDRVHFNAEQFPFVLRRETLIDVEPSLVVAGAEPVGLKTEQFLEVTASELPYQVGEQLLGCCSQSTYRLGPKGNLNGLEIVNRTVPGGIVESRAPDFNADENVVRWSVTRLLAFGVDPPAEAASAKALPSGKDAAEASAVDELSEGKESAKRKARRRRRVRPRSPKVSSTL